MLILFVLALWDCFRLVEICVCCIVFKSVVVLACYCVMFCVQFCFVRAGLCCVARCCSLLRDVALMLFGVARF